MVRPPRKRGVSMRSGSKRTKSLTPNSATSRSNPTFRSTPRPAATNRTSVRRRETNAAARRKVSWSFIGWNLASSPTTHASRGNPSSRLRPSPAPGCGLNIFVSKPLGIIRQRRLRYPRRSCAFLPATELETIADDHRDITARARSRTKSDRGWSRGSSSAQRMFQTTAGTPASLPATNPAQSAWYNQVCTTSGCHSRNARTRRASLAG